MKKRPFSPLGRNAKPSRPCSPPDRTRSTMSRNGRATSLPSRTILIRPACSTTNSDDGSFGRHVMSRGFWNPDTYASSDSRGGVSPVGPPLGGALVGATLAGGALDGAAETSALGETDVAGDGVGAGERVGLLQPTTARVPTKARARRRPIRGC